MPAVQPKRRRILPILLIIVLAVTTAWGGPRLIRAHAALLWTRYHTAQPADPRGDHIRETGRWATTTLWESAPLPWGAEACQLALALGAREESARPEAALALYERLRVNLEQITTQRWRGMGLAGVLDEARRREQELRQRRAVPPPAPAS
jgi:hypothetical protein